MTLSWFGGLLLLGMTNLTIEPELDSLEKKLKATIAEDQKEVKFRQKRIKTNEALLTAIHSSRGAANPAKNESGYGTKADVLRAAIKQITKPRFTVTDIEAEIKRANPAFQINGRWLRTALWTANKKHELVKTVVDGSNVQPAQYEKLSAITELNPPKAIPSRRPGSVNGSSIHPKSFLLAAREAIQHSPDRFSTAELFNYSQQKYPGFANKPTDFSNALWVLHTKQEIEKLEISVGNNPATYRTTEKFRNV